jgi:trimeric autotransporter adhesin
MRVVSRNSVRGQKIGGSNSAASLILISLVLHHLFSFGQAAQPSTGRTIHGVVKSGNMPIPGATVSATNDASKDRVATTSDVDGSYSLRIPADGTFTLRIEMPAFAVHTQTLSIDATHNTVQADVELTLLSRVREQRNQNQPLEASSNAASNNNEQQRRPASNGRGFQNLSVFQNEAGQDSGSMADIAPAGMPVPGVASDSSATESVAVAGNTTNSFNSMSPDQMQQRFDDARQNAGFGPGGGGFGGFGGGGPGGPRGGGGGGGGFFGRRFDSNRPHGSIYYGVGDSALNAAPFSLTGAPTEKPAYFQNSFGGSVGGPLNIPHIYNGGTKTFYFVNFNGKLGENPFDQFSTVPTLLERQGNFAALCTGGFNSAGVCNDTNSSGETIDQLYSYNPVTGTRTPFANNLIPGFTSQTCPWTDSSGSIPGALLQYIPCPNLPGSLQNFHYVTAATSDSDDLNVRINHTFGAPPPRGRRSGGRNAPHNNLTVGFHYHQTHAIITNPFPSVGGATTVRSFDIPISYTRTFGHLSNIVRFDFNRNRTKTQNLYAFNQDITSALGITGVSTNPFDWGLPNLSFSDFASLSDTTPALNRSQTYTLSDNVIWTRGKHTFRWGGDYRRVQVNIHSDGNPRGTFVFTGTNTAQVDGGNAPIPGTGYDFADFLLGLPQQTSEQFGQSEYFRGNYWDLYLQDEWKMRPSFTINAGIRYEYVSPLVETDNRLVNLALAPGVLNPLLALGPSPVVPVQPGTPGWPSTLVRPDRNNFAPRVGFAWKPLPNTVVRGGYGINYNTGAYQGIVEQLALQPPFATTATNIQNATGDLTLQNGFPAPAPGTITNSYAVNPNYRLGYVQIRNLDIQQQIRPTLLLNLDYTGTKGTNLDVLEAPNRTLTGLRIPAVDAFTYETSVADAEANAASVRLRKRLSSGFSIGGTYTYFKSIDDASSIGAGATSVASSPGLGSGGTGAAGTTASASSGAATVAQNPFDLSAERGLSSFYQKHRFTADYLIELPFGHDKRWLTGATPARAILGDWQISGDWTIASGVPFTPHFLNDAEDVETGANNTLRPDLVPGQFISLPHPSITKWFNTAAFTNPPENASGQLLAYGNARRNSIIGPGTRVFDMAFTKLVPLKESRSLEFRAQATNIFNLVNYSSIDTNFNSPTFGRVTAASGMRQFTMTARFRF